MPISVLNIDDVAADQGVISCPEPAVLPPVSGMAWKWRHDLGTNGDSCGNSSLVSTPSVSGQARRFDVSWSGFGGERFSISLGNSNLDSGDLYFTYDVKFYSTDMSDVNNLEFDLNQVIPNGKTVIFGMQFNYPAGFVQYTRNNGGSQWVSSSVACTRPTNNAWHHFIFKYHRDTAGNVTYDSISVDGVLSAIGQTVNSGFTLGWTPIGNLVLNFQVGGNNTAASTICYLDDMSLTGSGSGGPPPTVNPALALTTIPGFSDLPDTSLSAESPALGIYLARIADNAAFGLVRFETFYGLYKDGETVGLPTSSYDGYNYSRSELMYCWAIQNSTNPSTHWLTGPDSLWYGAWLVDQTTGLVSSVEAYRKSGDHPDPAISNDGTLGVFTIAQRLRTTILVSEQQDAYVDLADAEFVTDAPLSQRLIRGFNDNAKFGALNAECIYMGEFKDGDTVPTAVSPADGYAYTYPEIFFTFSWRWTVNGTPPFTQPNLGLGQLDRIAASVSSVGVVNTGIFYKASAFLLDPGAPTLQANHGRIAVFAFCSRSDLIDTIPSVSNEFQNVALETFMPGETFRASNLLQVNKNIREAVCSPEFFGPANYVSGDTIPLPVSTLDGYTYSRDEIAYVWDWAHTTPQSTGQHYRLPAFMAHIDGLTGVVTVKVYRLPPGGPYVSEPSGDSDDAIRVLVIGIRGAVHPALPTTTASEPGDATSTTVTDNGVPDNQPYPIALDMGEGSIMGVSQVLLKHKISGDLLSVIFVSGLPTSAFGARVASTGTYVITIKIAGVTKGTITYSAGNLVPVLSFTGTVTASPLDLVEFVGQASPDATLSGIYGTMSGTRT